MTLLRNKVLFLVIGKSGSGKTSVCEMLERRIGAKTVKSYTTRPKRTEEEDDHIFVESFSEWTQAISNQRVAALTQFDGYHYWTTEEQLEDANLDVLDLDGVKYLQHHYRGDKTLRIVYLDCPAWDRYLHMRKRGAVQAIKRIIHDHNKFHGAREMADYIVESQDIEDVYNDVLAYMLKEDGIG